MASEMGHSELDSKTNESQKVESSYRIVTHPAPLLPFEFRSLIIGPFLNSLRYGNDLFKLIDKDAYYFTYSRYIENLLSRPQAQVKLAMLSDDTVLGWSLLENRMIHFVWVKKEVRRQGIAQALCPKNFDTITHITNKGINIWGAYYPEVRFNPFI